MGDASERAARVSRLIALEPPQAQPSAAEGLRRLCSALLRALPASGVAVTLIVDHRPDAVVAASDATSERLMDVQRTVGDGPSLDAAAARRPVLEPDLAGAGSGRWPAFGSAAQDAGVRAVFAFPIQVGEARLGVLEIYRDTSGSLTREQLLDSLAFAEAALETVLDGQERPASRDGTIDEAMARNAVVYQAQGMVMVQLGVTLIEALSLIRAHAFAHDQRLGEVAHEIVAGRLAVGRDGPRHEG
jgi:hypothetical protein